MLEATNQRTFVSPRYDTDIYTRSFDDGTVFRELHSGRNELATLTHIDIAFVRSRYERKGLLENVFL